MPGREEMKGAAEFHRLALIVGQLSLHRVAHWIDTELGVPEGSVPLCEELASGTDEEEVRRLASRRLQEVPGTAHREAPARTLLGVMGRKLSIQADPAFVIASRAARVAEIAGLAEASEAEALRNRMESAGEDREAVSAELMRFLERFGPEADRFIRSGRI